MGLSTLPTHTYRLLDWPTKVQELADQLKLDSFAVLGASGGGPYALACAKVLPENRLRRTGVLAGMGPVEFGYAGTSWQRYVSFQINRYLPSTWLHWIINRSFVRPAKDRDPRVFEAKVIDKVIDRVLPSSEKAYFNDPQIKQDFTDDWRQAFKQGAEGYVHDSKIIFSPWGFRLSDISGEVRLWYGTEDYFTPVGMGRYLASHMPNAKLTEVPGATHGTVCEGSVCQDGEKIFSELIGTAPVQ